MTFLVLLSITVAAETGAAPGKRVVLGWVEWITLEPWGLRLKARLDTGASTASVHAEDIERFEDRGKDWARFTLNEDRGAGGEKLGSSFEVTRQVTRDVLIKQHGGGYDRRPVVVMALCLNGERHEAEFSLVDRGGFNYPVLLGRRLLADIAVVDPAKTLLASLQCPAT